MIYPTDYSGRVLWTLSVGGTYRAYWEIAVKGIMFSFRGVFWYESFFFVWVNTRYFYTSLNIDIPLFAF